jgi:hypothetical protein
LRVWTAMCSTTCRLPHNWYGSHSHLGWQCRQHHRHQICYFANIWPSHVCNRDVRVWRDSRYLSAIQSGMAQLYGP